MRFSKLAPFLLAAGLAGAARAQNVPVVRLQGLTIVTVVSVPALRPLSTPLSAPTLIPFAPTPALGPSRLPNVPSPMPLPMPAALAFSRLPAPASSFDWTFGDEDGVAPALVPVDPGPKPLPPAGARIDAAAQLRESAKDREPIRVGGGDNIFDGAAARPARQPLRVLTIPSDWLF